MTVRAARATDPGTLGVRSACSHPTRSIWTGRATAWAARMGNSCSSGAINQQDHKGSSWGRMLTACSRDVPASTGTARDGCLWGAPKDPGDGLVPGRVSTRRNGAQMTHNPEAPRGTPDWLWVGRWGLSAVKVTAPSPAVRLGSKLPLKLHEAPDPGAVGAEVGFDRCGQRCGRWPARHRAAPRTGRAAPRSAGPAPGRASSPPDHGIEHKFDADIGKAAYRGSWVTHPR